MWCCCCLSRAGNAGTKNCASATIRYGSCDIMVWWWSFQLNRHHQRRPSSSMAPFKMFISSFSFCSFFIVISFVINRKDSDRTDGPIDQGVGGWVGGWLMGERSVSSRSPATDHMHWHDRCTLSSSSPFFSKWALFFYNYIWLSEKVCPNIKVSKTKMLLFGHFSHLESFLFQN